MTTLPGPNRTFTSDRRPLSPAERLSLLQPRPARSGAQAIAEGLALDQTARDEGFADGAAGLVCDPQDLDQLAYFVGYWAGKTFGRANAARKAGG